MFYGAARSREAFPKRLARPYDGRLGASKSGDPDRYAQGDEDFAKNLETMIARYKRRDWDHALADVIPHGELSVLVLESLAVCLWATSCA